MKRFSQHIYHFTIAVILAYACTGCGLGLQEEFDFKPEIREVENFENVSAWDWVQTRVSKRVGDSVAIDGNEMDYMIQAIKLTGMEEAYQKPGLDKTILWLTNNAFTGSGGIFELVTGFDTVGIDDPSADLEKLKRVLQYHIITEYVTQIDPIEAIDVDYKFQTMLPGEDGEIYIRRNGRYELNINLSNKLPGSRRNTSVFRHNYTYNNGIAHIIQSYVRKVPF